MAEALEAAREDGIIHRGLKPANIKVRTDRTVKAPDVGLAKAFEKDGGGANSQISHSPTMSHHATEADALSAFHDFYGPIAEDTRA